MDKVTIIGATTWGTTLGMIIAQNGIPVVLGTRTQDEADELNSKRENSRFLSGFVFPRNLTASADLKQALHDTNMLILAVPSSRFRDNVKGLVNYIDNNPIILSASKGLELNTSRRMSQILQEELPEELCSKLCVLSGPNLALEIAQGKIASTVVASTNMILSQQVQQAIMSASFRIYTNEDVIGVELGGALKNIIALGAGISDGLGNGDNAKYAFITRGLTEITRLGVAAGASPLTFAGLAGLGDLIATCASPLSRNRYVGEQLTKGKLLTEILSSMKNVAEGVHTTVAALRLAKQLDVEMPITNIIYRILYENVDPRQSRVELMNRPPRSESDA